MIEHIATPGVLGAGSPQLQKAHMHARTGTLPERERYLSFSVTLVADSFASQIVERGFGKFKKNYVLF